MIAVRVLRDGQVVREQVFRQLPISIGRAADADLPLVHESVSRAHARVEAAEDGSAVLIDLASRNGVVSPAGRVERVPLTGTTRVRLGAVELEIATLDDTPTVAFQLPQLHSPEIQRTALHPLISLAIGVAALMLSAALEPSFWSPTETNRLVTVLSIGVVALIVLPLMATGLFVVHKVFGRRVRWSDPMQALAFLTCILPVGDVLSLAAYYVLTAGARAVLQTAIAMVFGVLSVVVLAGVRRSPPHLVFRLAWGVGTLAVILISVWIAGLSAQRKGEPDVDLYVQAPLLGWPGRTQSLEGYDVRVRRAAAEARRAAALVRQDQQRD